MTVLMCFGWGLAVGSAMLLLLSRSHSRRNDEKIVQTCHELRGPLTSLMLALDSGGVKGQREELTSALTLELARARRAVEDLSAQAAHRCCEDESRPVDLLEVAKALVAVQRIVISPEGRSVSVSAESQSTMVSGDRARLAQAVGNLINNAIEHGEGNIEISVAPSGEFGRLLVRDEGKGLPATIPQLLERPRRGQRGRGLRTVAEAIEAHGGTLRTAPARSGACIAAEVPLLNATGSVRLGHAQ